MKLMFIHIGAFNSIEVNPSASTSKNRKVKKTKIVYFKLRTETCPWFYFHHRAGGNLTKN